MLTVWGTDLITLNQSIVDERLKDFFYRLRHFQEELINTSLHNKNLTNALHLRPKLLKFLQLKDKRRIDISQSNQNVIRSRPDRSPSIKKYFSYTLRLIVPKHTRSHGRSLAVWRVSLQQISLWVPIIFWAFLTVCRCLSYHVDLELSNESVSIPRRKYRVGVNFVGASRRVCHVLSVFCYIASMLTKAKGHASTNIKGTSFTIQWNEGR